MNETLGKRIAQYRKEQGLTQENLAERLGISSQAVSKWETDQTCPDILLLPQLSKLLGVSVDTLLTGECSPTVQLIPEGNRKPLEQLVMHIIMNDASGDKMRVNLPMVLVRAALEIGLSLPQITGRGLENIDLEKVLQMAEMGLSGTLVEMDEANGGHIEVVVD
ncbi:MAG: helix-turn-helix transcriptional regulator [Clostridia bacterium]|nr:helix-turn-helix transcriptional regulator [Clostridia bacterium]